MTPETSTPARQYGFSHNTDLCVECRACELACKGTNHLEPGLNWRKVTDEWHGRYPDLQRIFVSATCRHCAEPACVTACPTQAISKRARDGIVIVDPQKCDGCGDCLPACPYDVPEFGQDGKMQKCDYCSAVGVDPVCARSCPSGALAYGVVD